MSHTRYRPDIDGLRAIAVLSVLFHHLSASLLPGGYIGVDIFFVISGFLITSQVYKEARAGEFSLRHFYKRRINRIVPALLTVVTATLAVGAVLLSPADLVRLAAGGFFAMVGLSNVFLWREYGNYFAANASEAPLLHTWSLGVEEQFYVIWPLMILMLLKLGRRDMLATLALLTIGAVVLSEFGVGIAASASYYLLPTRFFELMIGGLLALAVAHGLPAPRRFAGACMAAGYALIAGSLFWLDRESSFPGMNALWPCLGSALLIWAGDTPNWSSRGLESRPAAFIGLISYSLYLWHWPIIAYLHYGNIEIGPVTGTVAAAAAILLAWLSWRYVEVPMRRSGVSLGFPRVFAARFATPVAAILAIGLATVYTNGFPQRFDPRVAALEKALDSRPEVLRRGCHVPTALYDTPPSDECRLGADKANIDGILIGDSFANHFTGMLDVMAKAAGLSLIDYTMDGCPPILGYDTGKSATYVERCRLRNEAAYAHIAASGYRHVVLAANWPRESGAGEQLAASIEAMLNSGAELTLILNNTSIEDADSCPIRRAMYGDGRSCDGPRHDPPDYFAEIKARFPRVVVIDPNQVICSGSRCDPVLDGTPLYRDNRHLNDIGSRLIGRHLLSAEVALGAPAATSPMTERVMIGGR